MVIGVIILFVGASVVSGINSKVELADVINEIGNLNRGTETFYPTDDTRISHWYPDRTYGSDAVTVVMNDYGATSSNWAYDTLISFDISSVPLNSIINSAVLGLYYYEWVDNNPVGRNLNLYKITNTWNEETVTWNTQPSYASQPTTYSSVPPSVGTWMEWNVTVDVGDFVNGNEDNYGWKITDENYWGTSNIPRMYFRTKEYESYIPYLEVELLEPHGAFLFGRIENLNAEGDLTTFDAVRLRYLQFSPFSFNTYISGEEIAVVGSGLGIVTTSFAFGLFSAALL